MYDRRYEASALTGEGARLYGGRWNSPGHAAVYTSTTLSLAILEIIVQARRRIPPGMAYRTIDIPDRVCVEVIEIYTLDRLGPPGGWYSAPGHPALQALGDDWLNRRESAVLRVPSAIARIEQNVILNPNHPDFVTFVIADAQDLPADDRLRVIKRGPRKTRKRK